MVGARCGRQRTEVDAEALERGPGRLATDDEEPCTESVGRLPKPSDVDFADRAPRVDVERAHRHPLDSDRHAGLARDAGDGFEVLGVRGDVVDHELLAALEAAPGDASPGLEPVEHLPQTALRLAPQAVAVQQVHARHHPRQVGQEVGRDPAGRGGVGRGVDGGMEPLDRTTAVRRVRVARVGR